MADRAVLNIELVDGQGHGYVGPFAFQLARSNGSGDTISATRSCFEGRLTRSLVLRGNEVIVWPVSPSPEAFGWTEPDQYPLTTLLRGQSSRCTMRLIR